MSQQLTENVAIREKQPTIPGDSSLGENAAMMQAEPLGLPQRNSKRDSRPNRAAGDLVGDGCAVFKGDHCDTSEEKS